MESITEMLNLAMSNVWTYGVTFLFVLGVLVFVHEWGHYIVARMCGVKVDVFSVGFGREIFGWNTKSGTRWKISIVPLGGYVKMFGDADPASAGHSDEVEDDNGKVRHMSEEEKKVAFFAKPVWQRAAIVFAGPAINFLFAILIFAILYSSLGRPVIPPQISGIEVAGGADVANFMPHDVIKSVNGTEVNNFKDVRRMVILTIDAPMTFEVLRGNELITITATPKKIKNIDRFGFESEYGYMGFVGPADGIDVNTIAAINGIDVTGNLDKAHKLLNDNMGKMTIIKTQVNENLSEIKVIPPREFNTQLNDKSSDNYNKLFLGEKLGNTTVHYGPIKAIGIAAVETWNITTDTLKAIGEIFMGTRSTKELGGIIRIGAMAGTMAEQGYIALFVFMAGLSINLGLINLFPIPMLDGGHLVFYGVEALRGRPLSERAQEYAFRVGLVILVTLMVFSNLNDILQIYVFNKG